MIALIGIEGSAMWSDPLAPSFPGWPLNKVSLYVTPVLLLPQTNIPRPSIVRCFCTVDAPQLSNECRGYKGKLRPEQAEVHQSRHVRR
jgi:hypothetical protein